MSLNPKAGRGTTLTAVGIVLVAIATMPAQGLATLEVLMLSTPDVALPQGATSGAAPKTLAVVGADGDDEWPVAPSSPGLPARG
jgi:hypothetical protein